MKTIKMVFFDMDGTLIDSEYTYIYAWHELFKEYNIPIELVDILKWRGKSIHSINETINTFTNDMDATLNLRRLRDEIFYKKLINNQVELKPNALEILDFLDSKEIPYAIVTSTYKEKARRLLTHFNIMHRFKFIVYGDDVKDSKPAPDIYLKSLAISGYKKEEIVIFEDSENGIRAANNAGIDVIYVIDREKIDTSELRLTTIVNDFNEGIHYLSRYII